MAGDFLVALAHVLILRQRLFLALAHVLLRLRVLAHAHEAVLDTYTGFGTNISCRIYPLRRQRFYVHNANGGKEM